MPSPGEFETNYTHDPVCPHCGHRYADAWEIDFGGDAEGDTTLTCHGCDKDFRVFRHVEVTFTTHPV